MKQIRAVAQKLKSVDARNRKSCCGIRGNRHVNGLRKRHRIHHRRRRVNVDRFAVYQLKSGGTVHPSVGNDDEDAGHDAA